MRGWVALLLVAGLIAATVAQGEPLTDADVSAAVLKEILAPMADAARATDAPGIAVMGAPAADGVERRFFNEVADRLLEDGFDVWVLGPGAAVPGGALALDLHLTSSEIDYPRQTRTLMGAGRARVQRRVSLGASMRLTRPDTGQLLYVGDPERVDHEWMSFTEANACAAVRSDWIGNAPIVEVRDRNPWWQRGAILGIVGGVAIIYFAGAT